MGGGYSKIEVAQPYDKGILLRDILESGVVDKEKAYCLKHQAGNARDYLKKHHTQVAFEPVCVAQRGRYTDSGNRTVKGGGPIEQFYEAREDGKTNALTTVLKDNNIAEPVILNVPHGFNKGGIKRDKAPTLTANGDWQHNNYLCEPTELDQNQPPIYEVRNGYITHNGKEYPIKLADGFYIIRKLTVRECMRLQTVPEWYQFPVSNTQAYKMLGNGWTVDVIAHLLSYIRWTI